MSILHTSMPSAIKGHIGEHNLAKEIVALKDLDAELWFGVNFLPNVRDLDLILFHKKAGLYLLEVKALELKAIAHFDLVNFLLVPNIKRAHPQEQIRIAQIQLKTYIQSWAKIAKKRPDAPFMQTSIVWPLINRSEWNARFTDPQIRKLSESMLFQGDLRTSRNLVDALQNLWINPLGPVPPKDCRGEHPGMQNLRESIKTSEYKAEFTQVEKTEYSRLVTQSKDYASKYPAGPKYNVVFQGKPGTGKTTALREIALSHSSSGGSVLHICFNKTLAADQVREYQFLNKSDFGFIDVRDEWQFYQWIDPSVSLKDKDNLIQLLRMTWDERGISEKVFYDTIIIDEAQDCSENIFQALQLVSRPNASWFIAYGFGQEIDNFSSDGSAAAPWLKNWLKNAETQTLRRSFRNSTRAFLISQAFWEKYPDFESAKNWVKVKIKNQNKSGIPLELNLGLTTAKNDFKIASLGLNYKNSVKNLLLENIEESRKDNKSGDLLLVVAFPRQNAKENELSSYNDVLAVANEISHETGIEVFDLIPGDNRRKVTKLESIRIAHYLIVRGLSASNVILFDFDVLQHWCDDDLKNKRPPFRNLGNIALSRSKASTTIAVKSNYNSTAIDFIQKLLNYVRIVLPS